MSFLVEMPEHEYRKDACEAFRPQHEFCLGTAKAMIWLAQLANESDVKKIQRILGLWGFNCRRVLSGQVTSSFPVRTKLGMVVVGRGVTVVALANTDMLSLGHWFTEARWKLSRQDIDEGLNRAVEIIWEALCTEICRSARDKHLLFIAGHSSGGALSVIAADRVHRELNVKVMAIYTFGSIRPGGKEFSDRYPLAKTTYRVVYGNDLAASFPPRKLGYRHVGQMVYCARGNRFENALPTHNRRDARDLYAVLKMDVKECLRARFQPDPNGFERTDLLGKLFKFLPPLIADHIPASYINALRDAC